MREQGYVTLNEIINRTLFQMGESGTHKKLVALTHAQDIWRKLNYDVMKHITSVEITPTAARTIPYPDDYVDYVMLGICVSETGLIRGLGRSDGMCPLATDDCGNEVAITGGDPRGVSLDQSSDANKYYFWAYNTTRRGESKGQRFGYGGGSSMEGYFHNDKENRRFILSSDVGASSVILQYISDGVSCNKETQVHVYAEETIREYIKWKLCEGSKNKAGLAGTYSKNFWRAYRATRLRTLRGTYQELLQAFRRPYKQVAKS